MAFLGEFRHFCDSCEKWVRWGTCQNIIIVKSKGGKPPSPPSRLAVVLHGALLARCACGVLRGVDPVRQGSRLDAPLLLKPEGLRPQKGCGGVYP